MNKIDSRSAFADYCLRQLGGGVINIEISDEQIDDNIDLALQFYQEFHFDGIERDYVIRKITNTTFTVSDVSGWNVGDTLSNNDSSAIIKNINGNTITIGRITGLLLKSGVNLTNGTTQKTVLSVKLGDIDNKWIPLEDPIVSVNKVLNINRFFESSEYMFDAKYQIMLNEIRNLAAGSVSFLYGMMNYLGHLEYVLNKEKSFRFNRRMNRLFLDVNWFTEIKEDSFIALDVYKAVDDEAFSEIFNDLWLKKYCTALLKKQWGSNLKKYQGMQLPGGITYNGQQIYDEAVQELAVLEQQAISQSAPLPFLVG